MDPNFASDDSLTLQMPAYYQHNGNDSSRQNRNYNLDSNEVNRPFYPELRDDQNVFTNTSDLPAPSGLQNDHSYTYEGQRQSLGQRETFSPHSVYQQAPPYSGLDHPYFAPHANNNSPSLPPLHPLQPMETRLNNMNLSSDFNHFDTQTQMLHMVPSVLARATMPQAPKFWSGEPYARLIYEALKKAPGNRMVLKDIYKWFEQFTDKPQSSNSSGWKNSIRHNLSMNAAFEKIEARNDLDDGKKSYIWALSSRALAMKGVESTTRYRKNVAKKVTSTQAQHRVSKNTYTSQPTQLPQDDRYPILANDPKDKGIVIKQEQDSLDLTSFSRGHQQSTWYSQDYDNRAQISFPPLQPAWGTIQTEYHNVGNYPLLDRFSSHVTFTTPFSEQESTYARTQRNTPEDVQMHDSPTPSMTTAQSSFGYHDDKELEHQHQHQHYHHQVGNYHLTPGYSNDRQPRKESTQSYPLIYQEEHDVPATIERL